MIISITLSFFLIVSGIFAQSSEQEFPRLDMPLKKESQDPPLLEDDKAEEENETEEEEPKEGIQDAFEKTTSDAFIKKQSKILNITH